MATIPTPEQGKPILDFSEGTFDGSSYLFQSRNGATEHVSGDDVADYVNTSRLYNTLDTESKTPIGAINEVNAAIDEVNAKTGSDIAVSSSYSTSIADAIGAVTLKRKTLSVTMSSSTFSDYYYGDALTGVSADRIVSIVCNQSSNRPVFAMLSNDGNNVRVYGNQYAQGIVVQVTIWYL